MYYQYEYMICLLTVDECMCADLMCADLMSRYGYGLASGAGEM